VFGATTSETSGNPAWYICLMKSAWHVAQSGCTHCCVQLVSTEGHQPTDAAQVRSHLPQTHGPVWDANSLPMFRGILSPLTCCMPVLSVIAILPMPTRLRFALVSSISGMTGNARVSSIHQVSPTRPRYTATAPRPHLCCWCWCQCRIKTLEALVHSEKLGP